ncbi:DAK2 domain-containing protein [bacterium]|nr:DAK2 domain-containing protein [bacterium]
MNIDLKKTKVLKTKDLIQMIRMGVENLGAHIDEVNDLNVFPVPDGDTGTNMKRTIETGYNIIKDSDINQPIYKTAQDLSKGMLLGARGNSGVILSQIFRGFSNGLMQKRDVGIPGLIQAFKSAVKQAYDAVVKPVEGTVLTVLRESVQKASKLPNQYIYTFFLNLLRQARITLENTKEMLDVLKEADVIDSGGAGLTYIFEGFVSYFEGTLPNPDYVETVYDSNDSKKNDANLDFSLFNEYSELDYGYCTEFILQLSANKVENVNDFNEKEVIDYLTLVGDSVVCFKDGTLIKTHVHTKDPGAVLSYVRRWGEFLTIKVENMALQHNNKLVKDKENDEKKKKVHKAIAIVSVAQGNGLIKAFKDINVDEIVNGKQTMNPSTEDFIQAFDELDADNIFVLPNNSNIILAAEQARDIYKESHENVNVIVIKTKSIAQGYIAATMLQFQSDDINQMIEDVEMAISDVNSIEITTATKNTKVNGVDVKKNDYIGILNHNLVSDRRHKINCLTETLSKIQDIESHETLLLIFGANNIISQREKDEAVKEINKKFPSLNVDIIDGDQDVYCFIAAVC